MKQQQQISQDPDIVWLYQIFLAQGPMFVNAFRSDPQNGGGLAFALQDMGFKPLYARAALMGASKILTTIKLIQQMWADMKQWRDPVSGTEITATDEMIQTFIEDFCNPPEEESEEDPPIPEASPKVTPLKKKAAKK